MAKKSTTNSNSRSAFHAKSPTSNFAKSTGYFRMKSAEKSKYVRVIDESGEDYLYPASYFVPLVVPEKARRALSAVS